MTAQMREALAFIREQNGPVSIPRLAQYLSTTPAGAARTGSALLRWRLVRRARVGGLVHYEAI